MPAHTELHQDIARLGVLVVEDSALQRRCMVSTLRAMGVSKIYEAADGHAALAITRRMLSPPALVVVDLDLPGMDGIELLEQIAYTGMRPAIVIASAADRSILNSVASLAQVLDLPVLGVLAKPLAPDRLSALLARYQELPRERRPLAPPVQREVEPDALREAIASGCIQPHYQPKIALADGMLSGMEALARWRAVDGAMIPPLAFIPVAERSDLIDALTLALLDCILDDMKRWHLQAFYPTIAMNISARSLASREFASQIIRRVERARVSPTALVFEITESALVSDLATALGVLGRLRLKGFGLSIDDYGTGFSSMQQLSRLPFTELKIDRSFVCRAHEHWNLRALLESAIATGTRLGLKTVAEGIETRQELDLLRGLGCHHAQGYLIAAAMPAGNVRPWMHDDGARVRALCVAA